MWPWLVAVPWRQTVFQAAVTSQGGDEDPVTPVTEGSLEEGSWLETSMFIRRSMDF